MKLGKVSFSKCFLFAMLLVSLSSCGKKSKKVFVKQSATATSKQSFSDGRLNKFDSEGSVFEVYRDSFILEHNDRVFFELNKSNIPDLYKEKLLKVAEFVKKMKEDGKEFQIVLEGFGCPYGSSEYNRGLGAKRAVAVREFLIECGVMTQFMSVVSYGNDAIIPDSDQDVDFVDDRKITKEMYDQLVGSGEKNYSKNRAVRVRVIAKKSEDSIAEDLSNDEVIGESESVSDAVEETDKDDE